MVQARCYRGRAEDPLLLGTRGSPSTVLEPRLCSPSRALEDLLWLELEALLLVETRGTSSTPRSSSSLSSCTSHPRGWPPGGRVSMVVKGSTCGDGRRSGSGCGGVGGGGGGAPVGADHFLGGPPSTSTLGGWSLCWPGHTSILEFLHAPQFFLLEKYLKKKREKKIFFYLPLPQFCCNFAILLQF